MEKVKIEAKISLKLHDVRDSYNDVPFTRDLFETEPEYDEWIKHMFYDLENTLNTAIIPNSMLYSLFIPDGLGVEPMYDKEYALCFMGTGKLADNLRTWDLEKLVRRALEEAGIKKKIMEVLEEQYVLFIDAVLIDITEYKTCKPE